MSRRVIDALICRDPSATQRDDWSARLARGSAEFSAPDHSEYGLPPHIRGPGFGAFCLLLRQGFAGPSSGNTARICARCVVQLVSRWLPI
jgi:hypothetical protein